MKKIIFLLGIIICFVFTAKSQLALESVKQNGDSVFTKVDSVAHFQGGSKGWLKFLEKNLNANITTDNGAPTGKYVVILSFTVGKDGSLSNIAALTHCGYGTEQECIRLMKSSPKWIPAMVNGKLLSSVHKQPITFIVESN